MQKNISQYNIKDNMQIILYHDKLTPVVYHHSDIIANYKGLTNKYIMSIDKQGGCLTYYHCIVHNKLFEITL